MQIVHNSATSSLSNQVPSSSGSNPAIELVLICSMCPMLHARKIQFDVPAPQKETYALNRLNFVHSLYTKQICTLGSGFCAPDRVKSLKSDPESIWSHVQDSQRIRRYTKYSNFLEFFFYITYFFTAYLRFSGGHYGLSGFESSPGSSVPSSREVPVPL